MYQVVYELARMWSASPVWCFWLAGMTVGFGLGIANIVYNIFFHPLARFPGPKIRAVSEIPYLRSMISGYAPQDQLALHKRYGPVVRVAPNELTFNGARAFRDIYGSAKGRGELAKDKKYYRGIGDTLLTSDTEYHAYLRRLLAPGFSNPALRKQELVLNDFVDVLVQEIDREGGNGKEAVDLVDWFNFFAFDIITFLTYGESSACLERSDLRGWVQKFRSLGRPLALAQAVGRLPAVFRYPLMAVLLPRRLLEDRNAVYSISREKVEHRLKLDESRVPDFMTKLIDEYRRSNLTFEQLNNNATFLLAAGSETLATILAHLTFRLITNPRALSRAVKEVRNHFASAEEITLTKVNGCKYLNACIQEGLRVQAPSPATHPRYTPRGGCTIIDETPIPGDVAVGVPIYAACRSPTNFRNPDHFVPERWTGEDSAYDFDVKEAAQVFSVGPRDCLGRNLALAELKLVIARLLWQYDMEQCFPNDWADQKVFLVWEKTPLMVKLQPATTCL
ncbi:Cytochrome P450 monooxygenase [Pseudocercospora fuligena]|uniref:Cytochrome P450 monooxygenase n=1 Tax=Pseudocercospora fuligena TaxID=685502 RepID=A0A8H6RJ81_9PEZI|nr:Cytochrome P450 monooxygenase [Pseudocercospora fuligena]